MARHEHDADTLEDTRPVEDTARQEKMTPAEEAQREADRRSPAGTDYDTPPKEWVAGTVVPEDTAPEDMTDAEYIQWMYENLTPFWAIKRNMLIRRAPVLSSIEPSSARIGDESFVLVVSGVGFVQDISVIVFAGQDEPTKLETNGTLTTGVNMSVWHGPDEVEVRVKNGEHISEPLMFTFTAAPDQEKELEKARQAKRDRGQQVAGDHDEHKHEHADYPPSEEEDDDEEEDDGKGDKKKKRGKHKK